MSNLEKAVKAIYEASVWKPLGVSAEPVTGLTQWKVMKVNADFAGAGATIHFVGYAGYEGRVSSPIESYDSTLKQGTSRSGRIYQLLGEPGHNSDAMHTFGMWLHRAGSPEYTEITNEYQTAFKETIMKSEKIQFVRYLRSSTADYYGVETSSNLGGITFVFTLDHTARKVQIGFSVCDREDNFDKKLGIDLAVKDPIHQYTYDLDAFHVMADEVGGFVAAFVQTVKLNPATGKERALMRWLRESDDSLTYEQSELQKAIIKAAAG